MKTKFKILKLILVSIINLSIFFNYKVSADIRSVGLVEGAIFEYTGDDLQNLRNNVQKIIRTLKVNSNLKIISSENVTLIINRIFRGYNGLSLVCNDISERYAIANLIFGLSNECKVYGNYLDKLICLPNYMMNISNLIQGAIQLHKYISINKRCCISANVNIVANSVTISNRNLAYELDVNKNRIINNLVQWLNGKILKPSY